MCYLSAVTDACACGIRLDVVQFFLRTTDDEVHKYLKIFTFIRVVELDAIMQDHKVSTCAY